MVVFSARVLKNYSLIVKVQYNGKVLGQRKFILIYGFPQEIVRVLFNSYLPFINIGCSFKFIIKVSVEESIVNAPLVSLQSKNTKSEVRFEDLIRDGVFTIDSSTLTLKINLMNTRY
jgi:hypothetical protein